MEDPVEVGRTGGVTVAASIVGSRCHQVKRGRCPLGASCRGKTSLQTTSSSRHNQNQSGTTNKFRGLLVLAPAVHKRQNVKSCRCMRSVPLRLRRNLTIRVVVG